MHACAEQHLLLRPHRLRHPNQRARHLLTPGPAVSPKEVAMGRPKPAVGASGLAGTGTSPRHWNNAWSAAHGFAVLTYTARGFHRSCGQDPTPGYSYATDPACAGKASWTHLADRRWEIHDTQYLVGLLVDAGIAAPSAVVVTGDSYGGGQPCLPP